MAVVFIAVGLLIGAATLGFARWVSASPSTYNLSVVPVIGALVLFVPLRIRRDRRWWKCLCAEFAVGPHANLTELVRAVAGQQALKPSEADVEAAVKRLIAQGRVGQTIRLGWGAQLAPVEPFAVAFEPRLLNEADPAFMELEAAGTSTGVSSPGAVTARSSPGSDSLFRRRLRRGMLYTGGLLFCGLLLNRVVRDSVEAWRLGHVTVRLLVEASLLLVAVAIPWGKAFVRHREWLVVPGALLLRRAQMLEKSCRVEMFLAKESVLCAYKNPARGWWTLVVADSGACETIYATRRELDFLLRAWLSPVAPPSAEQLTDLV